MLVGENARVLVTENAIESNIAPYLNTLKRERIEVLRHSLNVAYLVTEIILRNYDEDLSIEVEKDSLNEVIKGALLHDIGKLQISNNILLKREELTDAEFEELRKHPIYGYESVKDDATLSKTVKDIILSHHEKPDGKGYPNHITDIPNSVKIVNICDRYIAMRENRSYRKKKDSYTTLKILFKEQMDVNNPILDVDFEDFDIFLLLASVKDK